MSEAFEELDDAATAIADSERRELIPAHIAFRHELNAAEQENIARGRAWAFARPHDPLSEKFVRDLHQRMLGDVWRWAGRFRSSARNIGVEHWRIQTTLRELLDDTRFWIAEGVYPADETAVRFHHRLVLIHPFPNGNGRHARLMADLLSVRLGNQPFTWGGNALGPPSEIRGRYIAALRAADGHDLAPLLVFSRS